MLTALRKRRWDPRSCRSASANCPNSCTEMWDFEPITTDSHSTWCKNSPCCGSELFGSFARVATGEPKPPHGFPEGASAVRGVPPAGAPGPFPPAGWWKGGEDDAGRSGQNHQRACRHTPGEEICRSCRTTCRYGHDLDRATVWNINFLIRHCYSNIYIELMLLFCNWQLHFFKIIIHLLTVIITVTIIFTVSHCILKAWPGTETAVSLN